jgi:Transposase DDE domain
VAALGLSWQMTKSPACGPGSGSRPVRPTPHDEQIDLLQAQLQRHLGWHRARLNFLAKALLALLVAGSVNLTKVARAFRGPAQLESHYKRLQRFLRGFDCLADGCLARLLAGLSGVTPPWTLSLDRSDWRPAVGGAQLPWINFLVLGIVRDGVAYPLLWTLLPKAGSSNAEERIALMERFLALFGSGAVRFIAMDREFGTSKAWVQWLAQRGLDFRLRLCISSHLSYGAGKPAPVGRLFGGLRPAKALQPRGARRLFGVRVRVAVLRLPPEKCALTQAAKRAKGHGHPGDELVVVVGAYRRGEPVDLLADYRLRWGIESLFGALKSRGFDLESTHLHHRERLERLLALLALAFGWAHRTGLWVAEHVRAPRLIAKYGRRAKSLFRLGLDTLCQLLAPAALRPRDRRARFRLFAKVLSCA